MMHQPDAKVVAEIRALSRALFGGAQYRVEIGRAIADGDGLVCIKDLTSLTSSATHPGTGR
jgi:hypothetical protein